MRCDAASRSHRDVLETAVPARYRRVVRRLVLLFVLALGLAACGGSGASKSTVKITLGRSGGTIVPWSITIHPGGAVTGLGPSPKSIPSSEDAKLSDLVRNGFAGLKSEQCAGTFPDESATFITALGRTVTVRGTCEPGFTKLWNKLVSALGLPG
jgi:hypothetical protein